MSDTPDPIVNPPGDLAVAPAVPAPGPDLRPVQEMERIVSIDVLRGFALFGIFWVNIVFFGRSFMEFLGPIGDADASGLEVAAWSVIRIFFEFKFISMFSLLFGVGMAIQLTRAEAAGRPFGWMYLRRIVILGAIGLFHALILWYGDILFIYAACGLMLLAVTWFGRTMFGGLQPRVLLVTAAVLFVAVGVFIEGCGALRVAFGPTMAASTETGETVSADTGPEAEAAADDPAPIEGGAAPADADAIVADETAAETRTDVERLRAAPFPLLGEVFMEMQTTGDGERWKAIERIAYAEGPFASAFAVRSSTFGLVFLSVMFSIAWRTLAIFLAGVALVKLDFFSPSRRAWHRRCLVLGLGIGVPMEVVGAWVTLHSEFGASWGWLLADTLHYFGSMAMCMGYVGAVLLLVRGAQSILARALGAVGRMALSNYILQTLVATSLMYWWGFGLFGRFERAQLILFVLVIFPVQMVLSLLWLRLFRMGPLEWLWRTLTYLRPPALLRGSSRR